MPITISLKRAAEESGLSMRTLRYAIERGELKSCRVGTRLLISVKELERFLLAKQDRKESKNAE